MSESQRSYVRKRNVTGTVYLIHFDKPYKHAKHYTGWTEDLPQRLADHQSGRGSKLMAVIQANNISWSVARIWENATKAFERQLKRRGGASRVCPRCKKLC